MYVYMFLYTISKFCYLSNKFIKLSILSLSLSILFVFRQLLCDQTSCQAVLSLCQFIAGKCQIIKQSVKDISEMSVNYYKLSHLMCEKVYLQDFDYIAFVIVFCCWWITFFNEFAN